MIAASLLAVELGIPDFFFAILAIAAIVGGLRMVTTNNVVHAALYLLIVLAAVAGEYILLGAEFVAATQIMVYVGAILVLLLFGVMLTRDKIGAEDNLNYERRWIGALVGACLFAVMGYALVEEFGEDTLPEIADGLPGMRTADVADSIFGTYIVPFEAISVLLLAALIGAIVVARRD